MQFDNARKIARFTIETTELQKNDRCYNPRLDVAKPCCVIVGNLLICYLPTMFDKA